MLSVMKKILNLSCIALCLLSCQELVEDINTNPNNPQNVRSELLLKGMMLADISVQVSHIQRISGMWSGQYRGEDQLYQSLFEYNITAAESDDTWEAIYVGVVKQGSLILEGIPTDRQFLGITKIIEAHAVGTAAAIYGDIPYSQTADDENFPDPVLDGQSDVYAAMQDLLDEAIADLESVSSPRTIAEDIFFSGDIDPWIEVANTLKARYYLQTKDYDNAYNTAQNGISSPTNSLKFIPLAVAGNGDSNLLNVFIAERGGFMSTDNTYLEFLLDVDTSASRNNAKTHEDARWKYFQIGGSSASREQGVAAQTAPMPLVIYEENLLILAESATREVSFDEGLSHLNDLRNFLASGQAFDQLDEADSLLYEPYILADFQSGGMENADDIDPTRALLREITEERYVTGYGQFIPFNDARRLRKDDADLIVAFPINVPSVSQHPERFIIAQDELNANSNARPDPGIFSVTEVNR